MSGKKIWGCHFQRLDNELPIKNYVRSISKNPWPSVLGTPASTAPEVNFQPRTTKHKLDMFQFQNKYYNTTAFKFQDQ